LKSYKYGTLKTLIVFTIIIKPSMAHSCSFLQIFTAS